MIHYENCPICDRKLRASKYTDCTTYWCIDVGNDISNYIRTGRTHFNLYSYETYQYAYAYIGDNHFKFDCDIIEDNCGNEPDETIKTLDDFIALVKRYYKLEVFA